MTQKVKIKLDAGVDVPVYAKTGDSGVDVKVKETITIEPKETKLVSTGIYLQIPKGMECQVRPRSGNSLKTKLRIPNAPGTIDSGYRSECKVIVENTSEKPIILDKGIKIAQFVFVPVYEVEFDVVDTLDETDRGSGGFGSTD